MNRSPEDVRAEFQRKGISIAGWATAHGFNTNLVFEVLAGRKKGIRGQSHRIAVMLGLKEGEIANPGDIDHSTDRRKVERRHAERRTTGSPALANGS